MSGPLTTKSSPLLPPPPGRELGIDGTTRAPGIRRPACRTSCTISNTERWRSFFGLSCTSMRAVPPVPALNPAPPMETDVKTSCTSGMRASSASIRRATLSVPRRDVPGGVCRLTEKLSLSSPGAYSLPTSRCCTRKTLDPTNAALTTTTSQRARTATGTAHCASAAKRSKPASQRPPSQATIPCSSWRRIQRAPSIGVSVNDTASEKSVAATIVRPYCRKSWPTMPDIKAIGVYTTMSAAVMASAASPISLRPLMAANCGSSPRCKCRWMFSSSA